jgi:hypothetical protein
VTIEDFRELSLSLAILFGWLSIVPLLGAWYARRKFRAFLKAPLSDEVEHLTHVWENRIARWSIIGLAMAGFSILCFVMWLVLAA